MRSLDGLIEKNRLHHVVAPVGARKVFFHRSPVVLAAIQIKPKSSKPGCAWLSSVSSDNGRPMKEDLSGPYWRDNMVKPVLFYEAVQLTLESQAHPGLDDFGLIWIAASASR
jgi:hypothetical protein